MLLFKLIILRLEMSSKKPVRVMCRHTFHFFPSIHRVPGRVSDQISIGLHTSPHCSSCTCPVPPSCRPCSPPRMCPQRPCRCTYPSPASNLPPSRLHTCLHSATSSLRNRELPCSSSLRHKTSARGHHPLGS